MNSWIMKSGRQNHAIFKKILRFLYWLIRKIMRNLSFVLYVGNFDSLKEYLHNSSRIVFSAYSQIRPEIHRRRESRKVIPQSRCEFCKFWVWPYWQVRHHCYFQFIGKKVDEIKVTDSRMTLSLNDYYRGIYIFQLRNAQGPSWIRKFQVAR